MWPTIWPKDRTSGDGLNEYWSSLTFSADLVMLPLIRSNVALVAAVSGLAGVCAAAGPASASAATNVHTALISQSPCESPAGGPDLLRGPGRGWADRGAGGDAATGPDG